MHLNVDCGDVASKVKTFTAYYKEAETSLCYVDIDALTAEQLKLFRSIHSIQCSPHPHDGCWTNYHSIEEAKEYLLLAKKTGKGNIILDICGGAVLEPISKVRVCSRL